MKTVGGGRSVKVSPRIWLPYCRRDAAAYHRYGDSVARCGGEYTPVKVKKMKRDEHRNIRHTFSGDAFLRRVIILRRGTREKPEKLVRAAHIKPTSPDQI